MLVHLDEQKIAAFRLINKRSQFGAAHRAIRVICSAAISKAF
jgi:hypothetical protein